MSFVGTTTQFLHAHVYAPLTIDDDVLRQLPPTFVDITKRDLSKAPQDRYQGADALAEELAMAAGQRRSMTTAAAIESSAADSTATLRLSKVAAIDLSPGSRSKSVLVPAGGAVQSDLPWDETSLDVGMPVAGPVRTADPSQPLPIRLAAAGTRPSCRCFVGNADSTAPRQW